MKSALICASVILLTACGRETPPPPIPETATVAVPAVSTVTAMETTGTITPGTTEEAATATATIAPVEATRTTTGP